MWTNFFMNNFDQQIVTWFLSHRSDCGINFFSVITFLGNWQWVLPLMALVTIVLFVRRKRWFIWPLLLVVVSSEVVVFLGKILFQRSRPNGGVFQPIDFSFPSGHAAVAVALYGYLSYVIIKLCPSRYNWLIIVLAVSLAVLIGFSRLYLGVHYLSDILVGYLLGIIALLIGINLSREKINN